VHRRNSRTILTSDAFWDIDVFRVDFLPSGTRQNAVTNHLFLSRECLPAQAVKWRAGNDSYGSKINDFTFGWKTPERALNKDKMLPH
jgi:hypothetical protein